LPAQGEVSAADGWVATATAGVAAGEADPAPRASGGRAALIWSLVLAASAATVFALRGVLLPFILAALLAYMLVPLVGWWQRLGLPRRLAILAAYALVATVAAGFVLLALPDLVAELQRLAGSLPVLTTAVRQRLAALRSGYGRLPLPSGLRRAVDQTVARAQRAVEAGIRQALADLLGGFQMLFSLALAPVLTYYGLADLPRIKEGFARLLPPAARQPVLSCLSDLDAVLAGFIRGEVLIALAVGALATVAALALGLRYAFTLGLAAFLGELIPYFGPFLGALPALAVAAVQGGLGLAMETGAAYLAIQQIESMLLAPRIVGGSVGLHPLLTIAALLVGEHIAGLVGMLFAVPAVASLRVLAVHGHRALTAGRPPRRLT
jgi:predicted PurR-regulated permease PerM